MQETKMKGPIEYIKQAWGIYFKKENFIFFAKIMAVLVIASTLLGWLFNYLYPDYLRNGGYSNNFELVGFLFLGLVSFVLALWTQATSFFAVLRMGEAEKEIFKLGYKYMTKLFLVTVVVGLIIFGGFILLIVPGFIFSVWYSYTSYLVLDKGLGLGMALKTSKAMVSGRFWKVLGRNLVLGLFTLLITVVLTAIPYVGQILISFIAPLIMLPFYLFYRDLSTGVTSS